MAFGRHWEWRGFGRRHAELENRLRTLPRTFPEPQEVADRYLWFPGVPLNLKLREGAFKVKRRLREGAGSLEEWLEDPAENYLFPLGPEILRRVFAACRLDPLAAGVEAAADEEALLARFRRAEPRVEAITVDKRRWQHLSAVPPGVLVEVAEVRSPEHLLSVSLEDPSRERVAEARDALGLEPALRPRSYLDALGVWARGERLVPP